MNEPHPSAEVGTDVGGAYALSIPSDLVEHLAERIAALVIERLAARPEAYLNVEEAAAYLAAPKSRLYELSERRAISVFRDGRRLLFRRSDLDTYLRSDEGK